MSHWFQILKRLSRPEKGRAASYRLANINAIQAVLGGRGPHGRTYDHKNGLRVVVNLAARHAAIFLDPGSNHPASGQYVNRSGLAKLAGKPLKTKTVRGRVDAVVSKVAAGLGRKVAPENIHYAAAELNGTGVSYFGDVCLVLKPETVPKGTLTLLRNSYDLTVAPVFETIYQPGDRDATDDMAKLEMDDWAGRWPNDACDMAVVKMLHHAPPSERLLTTGQISRGVLDDEDYIEIALEKGFGPSEALELRLSAHDVARETHIADRDKSGPSPSAAELIWRYRRREVDRNARRLGLSCRVVAHAGRTRS